MRNLLITSFLVLLPLFVFSQDKVSQYISNYQHIAISEMNRSGIPASITLAQGMFESAYGKSPSAVSYNNHFGIKCKKEWTGPYFYKHDDDRDKNGKLIPSCFRAYASVDESFQDHTNFLVERERYAELFGYPQTDYYNWAMGLQRCGYATNKMYAERLVSIIERYGLNQYDMPLQSAPIFVASEVHMEQNVEGIEVATDAFSDITSSSVIDQTVTTDLPEDKSLEDNTTTIIVLGSFEEFTSVAAPKASTFPTTTAAVASSSISSAKKTEPTVSRVNRAIILPANYRRKADAEVSDAKMEKR